MCSNMTQQIQTLIYVVKRILDYFLANANRIDESAILMSTEHTSEKASVSQQSRNHHRGTLPAFPLPLAQKSMKHTHRNPKTARAIIADALRASIHFSSEVVAVLEMKVPLSLLNRTLTIDELQRDVDAMQALVKLLSKE